MEFAGGTQTSGLALFRAVDWIASILTGSLALSIASIAVAWLGFVMLSGKLEIRRGLQTVFGCFLLFAAPQLAKSLFEISQNSAPRPMVIENNPTLPHSIIKSKSSRADPYAGAAMP